MSDYSEEIINGYQYNIEARDECANSIMDSENRIENFRVYDINYNDIYISYSVILAKVVKSESETILYVSPGLKGIHINGHYMAKSFLNHEFIHARHMMLGLKNTNYLERSAWSYNYTYARYHNLPVNSILKHLNSYGGFHIPKNYMWSNLGLDKFLKLF